MSRTPCITRVNLTAARQWMAKVAAMRSMSCGGQCRATERECIDSTAVGQQTVGAWFSRILGVMVILSLPVLSAMFDLIAGY